MIRIARKYHRWLMVFIGLQFLIWSITGVYMVTVDIHQIHGESLVKQENITLDLSKVTYSINDLITQYPNAKNITLTKQVERQVYTFLGDEKGWVVIDASSGELLPVVSKHLALQIAKKHYVGTDEVARVRLITSTETMPSEISPRLLPVWQVTFDSFSEPTLYISEQTGAIVTKRHDFWRLFDWMWRFHIMDYDDGENVSNWFLFVVALSGVLACLFGVVLIYYRVFRSQLQEAA